MICTFIPWKKNQKAEKRLLPRVALKAFVNLGYGLSDMATKEYSAAKARVTRKILIKSLWCCPRRWNMLAQSGNHVCNKYVNGSLAIGRQSYPFQMFCAAWGSIIQVRPCNCWERARRKRSQWVELLARREFEKESHYIQLKVHEVPVVASLDTARLKEILRIMTGRMHLPNAENHYPVLPPPACAWTNAQSIHVFFLFIRSWACCCTRAQWLNIRYLLPGPKATWIKRFFFFFLTYQLLTPMRLHEIYKI